jgi:carbonic anhydrase
LDVLQNGLGIGTCRDNQPPMVDYPTYSSQGSDYSDMHHFDIKVPGEHTVMGETFDAEIQMFHVHLNDPRMSSIGIPIRAIGDDTNQDFQAVLDEFELVYEENWLACDGGDGGNETLVDAAAPGEARPNQFDPYVFMTSMYFYRYDGSITEPPCRDITWWVMSDPLVISRAQLDQLKRLLLTNVDPDTCEFTCTHHEESVARPIQPLGENRVIEACGVGDFESDVEKGRPPAKQCREWKQEESWLW